MHAREREELEAQLSAYLDDELPAKERALVESWLEHDREAQALLEDLRAVRTGLQALPRTQGSAELIEQMRSRLERRALLGEEGPVGEVIRTPSLPGRRWVAAAAVIALTFVAGYVTWSFREPELPLAGDRLASAPRPEAQTAFRRVPSETANASREKVEVSPPAAPASAQPLAEESHAVTLRRAPMAKGNTTERPPSRSPIDDAAVAVQHAESTVEDVPPAVARARTAGSASPSLAAKPAAARRDDAAPPAKDKDPAIREVVDANKRTPAASPASPRSLVAPPPQPQEKEGEQQQNTDLRQVHRDEPDNALILKDAVGEKRPDSSAVAERPSLPVLANRAVSSLAPPSPSAGCETASKLETTSPSPARGYSVLLRSAGRVPLPSATAPASASQPASAPASQPASQPAP
ncbi:MAG: hypothetical protein GXY55_18575 [Phycisphaerae bacterium]|nr:hypothetical protein [Phycisphaerae bacterium]